MLRQISSDEVLPAHLKHKRLEILAFGGLINSLRDKLNFSYSSISEHVVAEGRICCNPPVRHIRYLLLAINYNVEIQMAHSVMCQETNKEKILTLPVALYDIPLNMKVLHRMNTDTFLF